jgi:hypothetical protein
VYITVVQRRLNLKTEEYSPTTQSRTTMVMEGLHYCTHHWTSLVPGRSKKKLSSYDDTVDNYSNDNEFDLSHNESSCNESDNDDNNLAINATQQKFQVYSVD